MGSRLIEINRDIKPIPPIYVNDGPVMENVQMGEEVNLHKFPVPKWHPDDGAGILVHGAMILRKSLTKVGLTLALIGQCSSTNPMKSHSTFPRENMAT